LGNNKTSRKGLESRKSSIRAGLLKNIEKNKFKDVIYPFM